MVASAERCIVLVGDHPGLDAYRALLGLLPELSVAAEVHPTARPRRGDGPQRFASVRVMLETLRPPDVVLAGHCRLEDLACLLRAGADVLVEPPVSRSQRTADGLEELAERLGRVLMTSAPLRHSGALRLAREAVRRDRIGPLRLVEVNVTPKDEPEAPLVQRAAPAFDALETAAGPIERVRMTEDSRLETRHAGDVHGLVWLQPHPGLPLLRCVGDRGEITVGETRTTVRAEDGPQAIGPGHNEWEARRSQLQHFLRSRLHGPDDLDHGAQTIAWAHAATRSRSRRRWEWA